MMSAAPLSFIAVRKLFFYSIPCLLTKTWTWQSASNDGSLLNVPSRSAIDHGHVFAISLKSKYETVDLLAGQSDLL